MVGGERDYSCRSLSLGVLLLTVRAGEGGVLLTVRVGEGGGWRGWILKKMIKV